jgi:hypothetical protein
MTTFIWLPLVPSCRRVAWCFPVSSEPIPGVVGSATARMSDRVLEGGSA